MLGVLVGAGAAFGPAGNPFLRLFAAFVSPRLSTPSTFEDPATVHVQDVLAVALLGAATLALLISLNVVSWVIALAEAGVAATAATTGVHVGSRSRSHPPPALAGSSHRQAREHAEHRDARERRGQRSLPSACRSRSTASAASTPLRTTAAGPTGLSSSTPRSTSRAAAEPGRGRARR